MKISEFINKYKNTSDIPEKYKKYFSLGKKEHTSEIIELIKNSIVEHDDDLLDCLLIFASKDGLDNKYSSIFSELLKQNWHYSTEDIIMYLGDIKDENTIESVFQATKLEENNYSDEPCPITKKCIWTLGIINTDKALDKIKLLSYSKNINIKETALLELKNRKMN
jgi:hypothetical protein